MFVTILVCGWIKAGQVAGVAADATATRLLAWMDDDLWVPKTSSALIGPRFGRFGRPGMIFGCGSAPRLPDRWPTVRVAATVSA
jgi:hypothetical protein